MAKLLDIYRNCSLPAEIAADIDTTNAKIEEHVGHDSERQWLTEARSRIEPFARDWDELKMRALSLPDLAPVRVKEFKRRRGAFADSVTQLHAKLTELAGATSPLGEYLFMEVKVPSLAKSKAPTLMKSWAELEKRLNSSYAIRLLTEEERYQPASPEAEAVRALGRAVQVVAEEPEALDDDAESALMKTLSDFQERARVPVIQARALLDAARAPIMDHEANGDKKPEPKPGPVGPAEVSEGEQTPPAAP